MTLPLSPSHRDSFLMYLVYMYIFSTSLLVFLINSCSGEFPGDPAITMSPPSAGRAGSVLIRDLRLHMPLGQKTQKTWKRNIIVTKFIAAAAKSLQSCPTLCDPIDGSPPGSPVPGILQARTLEWVAISFSNAWKWKVKLKSLSCVWLLATPWTVAYQDPLSMGFSRQEYWSGLPFPYF